MEVGSACSLHVCACRCECASSTRERAEDTCWKSVLYSDLVSSRRGTWVVRLYAITFTYWAISSACVAVFWKYKGAEGGLILFQLKRIFKNQKGVQGQNRATPENVGSGVQR